MPFDGIEIITIEIFIEKKMKEKHVLYANWSINELNFYKQTIDYHNIN